MDSLFDLFVKEPHLIEMIERMTKTKVFFGGVDVVKDAAYIGTFGDIQLYMQTDSSKEDIKKNLQDKMFSLEQEIKILEKMLSPSFLQKAPSGLVCEKQEKLNEHIKQLNTCKEEMEQVNDLLS